MTIYCDTYGQYVTILVVIAVVLLLLLLGVVVVVIVVFVVVVVPSLIRVRFVTGNSTVVTVLCNTHDSRVVTSLRHQYPRSQNGNKIDRMLTMKTPFNRYLVFPSPTIYRRIF